MAGPTTAHPTVADRRARGKQARDRTPLFTHTGWMPSIDRPDPVALLQEQDATREPDLVPVRHGRMADAGRTGPHAHQGAEQKAATNRQVIATMRQRLAAGEEVPRMYQDPGLAWLERQADGAEELVTQRKGTAEHHPES